jgi:4-aminobutyrate aminotransferase-like enzyme
MSDQPLTASALRNDPRLQQAIQLVREAVTEHRSALTGVRPPREECRQSYEETLQAFAQVRGGSLFYPYLGSGIGNGALVELTDGSVKYDMITGIGVHVFGHSDVELAETAVQAALADTVMQGNLQQNEESFALCRDFVELACLGGAGLAHCFLSTSGAMANENGLKILFQKRSPADRLLAFTNGFAGRTLAMSQVTDRPQNRSGLPPTIPVDYVPFYDAEDPAESTRAAVSRLREHLARYPDRHAGMILELIQGEGGYYAAPRAFFLELLHVLREHQVPVLFDEIQTFGRTSRPFAFQHLELDEFADVVTVGKMTQVCATLFTEAFVPRPGLISQTFTGATASILAARNILRRLRDGGYFNPDGRIRQIHARFVGHLEDLEQASAGTERAVSGPWGIGGMIACTVGDGSPELTKAVLQKLFEAGVIAFSAGASPTRIRMLPPLGVITDDDIDAVCTLLRGVILR